MAESALNFVIDKLTSLLEQEVKLQGGFHKEFEGVKRELESIERFLRDADARAKSENEENNESIKLWMRDLREVAYCIADIIDEYMMPVAQRPQQHGFAGFLGRIASLVKKLKQRHEIASQIEDVKSSIREIKERRDTYGFSERGEPSPWQDPRNHSHFIEEAELVAIEAPRKELVSYLVEGAKTRTVVGVVGMGGVGKTTLANKVYKDNKVKAHFDCRAWITVSQSYNIEKLLRSIISQFCRARREPTSREINSMEERSLIIKLREFSQQKRYLVACDDVWSPEFGRVVQDALPDNDNGGRIIMTTRNKDVAKFCQRFALLRLRELQPLPRETAYKLFCKTAFRYTNYGQCIPGLEKLSYEIAERCRGLPLAIAAMGGLMSTKGTDVSEWKKSYDTLEWELKFNPSLTSTARILAFSYNDLPHYLKFCFLYFGMFPEDYSIQCSRLMRLWIANGFIKEQQGIASEMMAEKYLTELIHRSLVQVEDVKHDGKVKTCGVHDLLRELILSKSVELSFKQVSIENCSSINGIARHISICSKGSDKPETIGKFQSRSILFFNVDQLQSSLIRRLFVNFKFLNVLDFENAPIEYIPAELGDLLYLSYLSIRFTDVETLPESIGELQNLETLDVRQSFVEEVPVKINTLSKLKYLLAWSSAGRSIGIKILGSVGSLEALQKLYHLNMEHVSHEFIGELGKLKQLRKLGIENLKGGDGLALCEALKMMNQLQSLSVASTSKEEFILLNSISSPVFPLEHLTLRGRLEKLPNWILQLKTLTKVYLIWSKLMDDPLRVLQTLPNLLRILLDGAYEGEQLHFEVGCFQKLKLLFLKNLNGLNKLIMEQGALISLQDLTFADCQLLKEVPSGIGHLKNLQTLSFMDMPREFLLRVVPDEGPDRSVVKHVPNISLYFEGIEDWVYRLDDDDDQAKLMEFLQC